ncbi:MAG: CBS domain-containing protein [Desulfobacterales bacterium]|nr:CBS domain-containing protein [Desulfobacterales bacterium]
MSSANLRECAAVDISDQDVVAAMKSMQGYIDITPADFREVYRVAYALAKERMMNALKAADIMSRAVRAIRADDDLIAAASLLAEKGISGAPVIDGQGRIVGVISEKDFLRKMGAEKSGSFMQVIALCLKNKGCLATAMTNRTAADIMTAPAITAAADISVGAIAALLMEKNINRLPIVDGGGRPVGIVTRTDLVNSYCMLG